MKFFCYFKDDNIVLTKRTVLQKLKSVMWFREGLKVFAGLIRHDLTSPRKISSKFRRRALCKSKMFYKSETWMASGFAKWLSLLGLVDLMSPELPMGFPLCLLSIHYYVLFTLLIGLLLRAKFPNSFLYESDEKNDVYFFVYSDSFQSVLFIYFYFIS